MPLSARRTAGLGALGLAVTTLTFGVGSAAAEPTDESFGSTGEVQTFVVPEGVCEISVDALGAEGGAGQILSPQKFSPEQGADPAGGNGTTAAPGLGGHATATVAVTPGESLS